MPSQGRVRALLFHASYPRTNRLRMESRCKWYSRALTLAPLCNIVDTTLVKLHIDRLNQEKKRERKREEIDSHLETYFWHAIVKRMSRNQACNTWHI